MAKTLYRTNYRVAIDWLHLALVRFNIWKHDEEFYPEYPQSLYDDDGELLDNEPDIIQTYITNATDSEVEWLQKTFPDLIFGFSYKFDAWILCVDHCGTSWDYVTTYTTLENAARDEGQKIEYQPTPEEIEALRVKPRKTA